jgi:hypothetical protein
MTERLRPMVHPATQDDPLTVFGRGTDDPAPDEVSAGSFAALGEMRITDDLDDLSRFGMDIGPDAA